MKDYESKSNKYADIIGDIEIGFNINEILNDEPDDGELKPNDQKISDCNNKHLKNETK